MNANNLIIKLKKWDQKLSCEPCSEYDLTKNVFLTNNQSITKFLLLNNMFI